MRCSVLDKYRHLFTRMEDESILNPDNSIDLYCLHRVFIPSINEDLQKFTSSWHNHPLSTEANQTPLQLWHIGLSEEDNTGITSSLQTNLIPNVNGHVQVPDLPFIPCLFLMSQMQTVLIQNIGQEEYDVYKLIATTVGEHLNNNCQMCKYD